MREHFLLNLHLLLKIPFLSFETMLWSYDSSRQAMSVAMVNFSLGRTGRPRLHHLDRWLNFGFNWHIATPNAGLLITFGPWAWIWHWDSKLAQWYAMRYVPWCRGDTV